MDDGKEEERLIAFWLAGEVADLLGCDSLPHHYFKLYTWVLLVLVFVDAVATENYTE